MLASRKTIDYLQNDKNPAEAKAWGEKGIRTGPDFIKDRLIDKEALGPSTAKTVLAKKKDE